MVNSSKVIFVILFLSLMSSALRVSKIARRSKIIHLREMTTFVADPEKKIHVLVPIANGSEEIESVTIINTLVRAGASVWSASVEDSLQITGSRGIKIVADRLIDECVGIQFDLIACPGGMPGAERLRDNPILRQILLEQYTASKPVAAVCASPAVIFADLGLLNGRRATCYPAPKFIQKVPDHTNEDVVVDGNLITSQGPGTTLRFSLKLVEILFGPEKATEIGKTMLA